MEQAAGSGNGSSSRRSKASSSSSRAAATPLHEACRARPRGGSSANRVPPSVIYAILDADGDAASRRDAGGNAPLHLACRSVDAWNRRPVGAGVGVDLLADADDTGQQYYDATINNNAVEQAANGQTSEQWEEAVERILSACPDAAGWTNGEGRNALMEACGHKHVPPTVVQSLLAANGDAAAGQKDNTGRCALAIFGEANGSSLAIIRLLLDACPESARFVDSSGSSPIHRPAFEGNVNFVESVLLRDESVATTKDGKDMLPLHRACQCVRNCAVPAGELSKLGVIQLLLEAYPEGAGCADGRGSVPIHYATSRSPNLDIIRAICEVDPSCASLPDDLGWTSLHNACAFPEADEVVLYLLELDPSLAKRPTKKGDLPLHQAANSSRSARVVQMMVDLYPDAVLARNSYGFCPLHVVCRTQSPQLDIIRILCEQEPKCISMRTNAYELPFHLVCLKPLAPLEVIQYFLDNTAGDDALTRSGNTPLHEACFRRLPYPIIERIATSRKEWVAEKNNSLATPLHLACKVGTSDTRIIQILLDVGGTGQLYQGDSEGHTPLHSVCRPDSSEEAVTFLLQSCPYAVKATTMLGETCLHLACHRDVPSDVLHAIARAGQREAVVQPNKKGMAPIHIIMSKYRTLCRHHPSGIQTHRLARNEITHKALFLINLLLGGDGNGEDFSSGTDSDEGLTTSVTLHDLLSVRRKYGWSTVDYLLIQRIKKMNIGGPSIDKDGNTPLHVEAGVSPFDAYANKQRPFNSNESLTSVLDIVLRSDLSAAEARNLCGDLPFDIMVECGRSWNNGMASLVSVYPQALAMWQEKQGGSKLLPSVLAQVTYHCGIGTTYELLKSLPGFLDSGKD